MKALVWTTFFSTWAIVFCFFGFWGLLLGWVPSALEAALVAKIVGVK